MAEARGWDPIVRRNMQRALVMLLADHAAGELIRVSDIYTALPAGSANLDHTIEILATMGVVTDDRPRTFDVWLASKLDGLAPAVSADVSTWATLMHDGGPRSRPRNPSTVRTYLNAVHPLLADWSSRYTHLCEVTRDDVTTHLGTLTSNRRQMTATALQSLFRWAKRRGLIFQNPTARITIQKGPDCLWQPLRPDEIAQTVQAASTAQARLFVALAAIHAARPGEIRAMQLPDDDLPNRRITIAGRERPLDELTYQTLVEWPDYRRNHWPNTANQHLVISYHTALGLGPVSATVLAPALRGLPASIDRLRIDRQLEEALASGGDPLQVAVVFGVDHSTAVRYATNARQLLDGPHETHPRHSPRTPALETGTEPG